MEYLQKSYSMNKLSKVFKIGLNRFKENEITILFDMVADGKPRQFYITLYKSNITEFECYGVYNTFIKAIENSPFKVFIAKEVLYTKQELLNKLKNIDLKA